MNVEKLENEIAQQTRNGRDTVYLKITDLKEIGFDIQQKDEERTFISVASVRSMLQKYKFKNRIKVENNTTINKDNKVNFKSAESFLDKEDEQRC